MIGGCVNIPLGCCLLNLIIHQVLMLLLKRSSANFMNCILKIIINLVTV